MNSYKIYYLIIGICCGILIGLALSPVIEKTLSLLITFVTTLVGVACGISKKKGEGETSNAHLIVNPMPFALVMVGIVLGSFCGMLIRNNDLFGDYRRKKPVTAQVSPDVKRDKKTTDKSNSTNENVTGLHSDEQRLCAIIKPLHGLELKRELDKLGEPKIDQYLKISTDSLWLEFIKTNICR